MRKYKPENWTMQEIANAMKGKDAQGRQIVIPLFQRGKRWSPEKREKFINSLLLGYPVGTLLFADRGDKTYSVIDGLQRSTTICEYVLNPTKRENLKDVDESTLDSCREIIFPNNNNKTINNKLNELILNCLSKQRDFNSVQVYYIVDALLDEFPCAQNDRAITRSLVDILTEWLTDYKQDYDTILTTEMPVIVYSSNTDNLHEIFERINKQGEPLTDYEIYAASWRQEKYKINNSKIVDFVLKKYDSLVLEHYELEDYNHTEMSRTQKLTAFEYLFGLGKYLINTYPFLNLEPNKKENEVSAIGFELVDVCLNNTKKIPELAEQIYNQHIDINLLERRIRESIDFVYQAIAPICEFKGNQRKTKFLHPKYFILAIIAFVLHEMYDIDYLDKKRDSWTSNEKIIYKRIQQHYVYGLVNNDWHDGGIGKMYSSVKDRAFMEEISIKSWESLLKNYFDKSLMAKEVKKVANPTNADKVLLNCIYLNIFTVNDQLSNARFDIEHLATKERMKALMKLTNSTGLPISSIANQCYLPESVNRKKKDKTLYEEISNNHIIKEIEEKYSFTQAQDFDFLYLPYLQGDFKALEKYYVEFLEKRFEIQKKKILEFLGFND